MVSHRFAHSGPVARIGPCRHLLRRGELAGREGPRPFPRALVPFDAVAVRACERPSSFVTGAPPPVTLHAGAGRNGGQRGRVPQVWRRRSGPRRPLVGAENVSGLGHGHAPELDLYYSIAGFESICCNRERNTIHHVLLIIGSRLPGAQAQTSRPSGDPHHNAIVRYSIFS